MTSRIEQLQRFVNEDPTDPFNLYALGLEYQKIDVDKAMDIFRRLLNEHGEYVPTYYHLGKLYHVLRENKLALQVFEQGIEVATKKKDAKALRELQAARQELLFED